MYLLRRRALFSFAAFYGTGVAAAYLFGMPSVVLLVCACCLGLASGALMLFGRKRSALFSAALILFYLAAACGGSAYTSARIEARPVFENRYDAQFSGRISGSPYIDSDGERFVCTLADATINGMEVGHEFRLYLRGDAGFVNSIGCGQTISGTGHVFCQEQPSNPHEFDFGKYLWREGLAGYVTANEADITLEGDPGGMLNALYDLRHSLGARIDSAFPKSSELVRALVLGDKRDMDDDIREDFSRAGVAHLLAISGLHITLMATAVAFLLRPVVGAWAASAITIVCIFCYGILIGFSPSVSRAAIMYMTLCGAPLFGRYSESTTRLSLAFLIILLIDPINIADPGFVLSFLASAGLIWLCRPLMRFTRLDRLGNGSSVSGRMLRYCASLAGATLSAQLFTYPALAAFYGTFSIISIASNIFLVPFCLVSLIASYAGIAFGFLAFIPDNMLLALRWLTGVCAGFGWSEIGVPAPPIWLLPCMLVAGILASEVSRLPGRYKPWLVPVLPVLIALSLLTSIKPGMSIVFLDVGQADSAVIHVDGVTCVVDLGEDGTEAADYINGENYTVDALFLSHPHSDHAGGLGEFAAECDIGMIYVPAGWFNEMSGEELSEEWSQVTASVPFRELSPGDEIPLSKNAVITVIGSETDSGDSGNDMSLIMLLDYGESEVLFTGDANVGTGPDADILKVGHHGSRTATDADVVNSVTPQVAVISVGRRNYYGHPNQEVIDVLEAGGAEVYRTDICGAITVNMDRDGNYKVIPFLEEQK